MRSSTAAARAKAWLRLSAETLEPSLADAALHLVYRLDEGALEALLADLAAFRARSPVPTGSTLTVHPGLAAAGLRSAYAESLHDLVLRHATEDALARVTVNAFAFDGWSFHAFDRSPAGWERATIPGLSRHRGGHAYM